MLEIPLNEYFKKRNVSYSLLSKLDSGQVAYVRDFMQMKPLEKYESDTKARRIGKYTDTGLFNPLLNIPIDTFYILADEFSEGLYTNFIDTLVDRIKESVALKHFQLDSPQDVPDFINSVAPVKLLEEVHAAVGFKVTLKVVLNKVNKDYTNYFYDKYIGYGMTFLTINEAHISDMCIQELKTNTFTKMYFNADIATLRGFEYLYQHGFNFEYIVPNAGSITTKVLLDIIEIDHNKKTIRGCDVKTRDGSAYDFRFDFYKWKYYLQASLYTKALEEWLKAKNEKGEYLGYTVNNNFKFIVVSTSYFNVAVYKCTETDIEKGLNGFEKRDGSYVKGVNELLDDVMWHLAINKWDCPRDVYSNDGIFYLNLLDKL